jgi:hypothetical protein
VPSCLERPQRLASFTSEAQRRSLVWRLSIASSRRRTYSIGVGGQQFPVRKGAFWGRLTAELICRRLRAVVAHAGQRERLGAAGSSDCCAKSDDAMASSLLVACIESLTAGREVVLSRIAIVRGSACDRGGRRWPTGDVLFVGGEQEMDGMESVSEVLLTRSSWEVVVTAGGGKRLVQASPRW